MQNSEVLDLAADAIERDGWTTGSRGMLPEGAHCAMGAIGAVIGAPMDEDMPEFFNYTAIWRAGAARALADYVAPDRNLAFGYAAITTWNDYGTPEPERIVEAFRAAALIESAKEKAYETEDQPLPVHIPASAA